jgi:hypothetical protein
MKTARYGWLQGLCAILLLMIPLGLKATLAQTDPTPPIELSEITMEYAVLDASGQLKWETPDPKSPNEIPAGAQKLRFTAKVNNRTEGSKIKLKAALQELCSSPDAGKPFLARLRHLTETEKEVEVGKGNKQVTIELTVHCEECVHAVCGKECPDRDHLGEGPHVITLTSTDPPTGRNTAAAKPASVRVDIRSVCSKNK